MALILFIASVFLSRAYWEIAGSTVRLEQLTALFLSAFFFLDLLRGGARLRLPWPAALVLAVFPLMMLSSLMASPHPGLSLRKSLLYVPYFLAFVAMLGYLDSTDKLREAWWAFYFFGVLAICLSLLGFLLLFFGIDVGMVRLEYDSYWLRGTMISPNIMGSTAVIVFLAALARLTSVGGERRHFSTFDQVAFVVSLAAILVSYTRAAWVGLVLGMVLHFILRRKDLTQRTVAVVMLLFVGSGLFVLLATSGRELSPGTSLASFSEFGESAKLASRDADQGTHSSGDATAAEARENGWNALTDGALSSVASERLIVTEVNWAQVNKGGMWVSEVTLVDVTGGSSVQVYYSSGRSRRGPFHLWSNGDGRGSNVRFANILAVIKKLDEGEFTYFGTSGALEFVTQDSSHKIQAVSRTYNGDLSRIFPALTDEEANTARKGRDLVIAGISNDRRSRSSVALFNPGAESVDIELRIVGSQGEQLGTAVNRTLAAREMNVITRELRDGLSYSSASIVISVKSDAGRVMASGQTAGNEKGILTAHLAVPRTRGALDTPGFSSDKGRRLAAVDLPPTQGTSGAQGGQGASGTIRAVAPSVNYTKKLKSLNLRDALEDWRYRVTRAALNDWRRSPFIGRGTDSLFLVGTGALVPGREAAYIPITMIAILHDWGIFAWIAYCIFLFAALLQLGLLFRMSTAGEWRDFTIWLLTVLVTSTLMYQVTTTMQISIFWCLLAFYAAVMHRSIGSIPTPSEGT